MTHPTETDRELLELAAKAASYEIEGRAEKMVVFPGHFEGGFSIKNEHGSSSLWNPLTDDGDALRLAVKLQFRVIPPEDEFGLDRASVRISWHRELVDAFDPDPYAATRRAIVCAAAEIGRAMR